MRLRDKVASADSSTGGLAWVEHARRSATHLRAVLERPGEFLSNGRSKPGDLVLFGRSVLRVVRKEVGGPRATRVVQWLEPGQPPDGKTFDHGRPLREDAWRG